MEAKICMESKKKEIISFLIIGLFLTASMVSATNGLYQLGIKENDGNGYVVGLKSLNEPFADSQDITFDTIDLTDEGNKFSLQARSETLNWTVARSFEQSKEDGEQVKLRTIEQTDDTIIIQYALPDIEVHELSFQKYNGRNTQRISFGNTRLFSEPGEPEMPYIPARVILPQGRSVDSVMIIPDEVIFMGGDYLLSYGEPPQPISCDPGKKTSFEIDTSVYESNEPYPSSSYKLHETQYGMGISISYIDIYPMSYKPLSGSLEYYPTFSLQIDTIPDNNKNTDIRVDIDRFTSWIGSSFENLDALDSYEDGEILGDFYSILDSKDSFSYVFITSDE